MPAGVPVPTVFLVIERGLLVLAGLLIGLAGAEFLVRETGNDPLDHLPVARADSWQTECARLADGPGYELLPGACGANSHGIFDRERTLDRVPGELRIVALGDSLTHDTAWTTLTEVLLGARRGAPVEVFDLGVTGYGTHEELGLLTERGDEFDPDGIVLQFCLNDYLRSPVFLNIGGSLLRVEDHRGALRSVGPLVRESALLRLFFWRGAASTSDRVPFEERAAAGDGALRGVAAWAKARDVPLLVVVYPVLGTRGADTGEAQFAYPHVTGMMTEAGIPFVDLTSRFTAVGLPSLRLSEGPAAFGDLEGTLARLGSPPGDARLIRSVFRKTLQVDLDPGRVINDEIHPNWVGHYLAAQAITDFVSTDAAWSAAVSLAAAPKP